MLRRSSLRLIATGAVLAAALIATGGRALASPGQVAIIEDDAHLFQDPSTTLRRFRTLGADVARVFVTWAEIAPDPDSAVRPAGFDATDPAAYPPGSWDRLDAIVRAARQQGIDLELMLTGGAPRWADGPGAPRAAIGNPFRAWWPSAGEFGLFVRAAGTRYSGAYPDPQRPGQSLPRVDFWSIWNEPNFGEDLAPQAIDGSAVLSAPRMYRGLLRAGWSGLQATGHGSDTILFGEVAASGVTGKVTRSHPQGLPGNFALAKPLQFLRALYCVDTSYRELRGAAARSLGCPTSRAGSRRFRAGNPALFEATGFADHPYPHNSAPDHAPSKDRNFASFPDLPRLERALDRLQRPYGSHRRLPIYNDEFGYITHPPNGGGYVSPGTAAYYLNWAEYLSWRSPRIASTMQYLLYDPTHTHGRGGFATGLLTGGGKPKPAYVAYRLPLYLPLTAARRTRSLEVWGCVRPAHYAAIDTGAAQTVAIQWAPHGGGFTTVRRVPIGSPRGYFDVRVRFRGSGAVRLAWSYPRLDPGLDPSAQGATIYSRRVTIRLR